MLHKCLLAALLATVALTGVSCASTKKSSMQSLFDGPCDTQLSSSKSCVQTPGRQATTNRRSQYRY